MKEEESTEHSEIWAFSHVMARLGCEGAKAMQLGSPFDYGRQVQFFVEGRSRKGVSDVSGVDEYSDTAITPEDLSGVFEGARISGQPHPGPPPPPPGEGVLGIRFRRGF